MVSAAGDVQEMGATAGGSRTVMPPDDRLELYEIDQILAAHPRLVDGDGNAIPLPNEVYEVLRDVVDAMRAGRAIVLTPTAMRLTTGEAAEILGVSRPTLVKLLENGRIPFEKPNRHRYIMLADLEEYRRTQVASRRRALAEITREAAEGGAQAPAPEDVAAALKIARKNLKSS